MSSACTLGVVSMDRSTSDRCQGIFDTSALIQRISMDCYLHIVLICYIQAVVDNSRCRTPVFMDFQSHCTCFDLLDQRCFIRTVSFSEESKIHRIFFCCFEHHFQVPRSRCTGRCIGSVCRTGTASNHRCHTAVQCTVDLLRADKMNVGINSASSYDHAFSCQCLCGSSNRHARSYAVHNIRISCFSDSDDFAVFDTDICFYDSGHIHDQCICDDQIQISVFAAGLNRLSHTVTDGFSASEFNFISIGGKIFFHFNDKACICQSYFIAHGRAVHHCIFFTGNFYAHLPSSYTKPFNAAFSIEAFFVSSPALALVRSFNPNTRFLPPICVS